MHDVYLHDFKYIYVINDVFRVLVMNNHLLQLCFSLLVGISLSSESFAQTNVENLYDEDSEKTIFRQAGNYSEEHDVLTIVVLRGTYERELYDKVVVILSNKLDSLQVPHKFFQKYHEKPGTGFDYFIENDMNGSFDANEFFALLQHIQRRYRKEYPN